jgi:DNA-directed RNA polymerase subunit RPC12/RpoP|nr:MAG TPA: 24-sterol C-methyltransferase [Caudoviricetes sp.]
MARTVKCPSCGGELTVKDENRDFMFCEYCGTKVMLDDYRETHRFVDEARIQESKDAKELELKKMEQERWRAEDRDKSMASFLKVMGLIIAALILYGIYSRFIG